MNKEVQPEYTAEKDQQIASTPNFVNHNEKVLSEALQSRHRFFNILVSVASTMEKYEDIIDLFSKQGNNIEEQLTLVHAFAQRGKMPIASHVLEWFFQHVSLDTLKDSILSKVFNTAVICSHSVAIDSIFELLIFRVQHSPDSTLPEICSCMHTLAQGNQPQAVRTGWQRLHSLLPENKRLIKMHRNFLEKYPDEEMKSELCSIAIKPRACRPMDRKKILLEIAKNPKARFQLSHYCNEELMMNPDPKIVNYWVTMSNLLADTLQDSLVANDLWSIILTYFPDRTQGFLRFSRRHNRKGVNADVDALIEWGHQLLRRTPPASTLKIKDELVIGQESNAIVDWLELLRTKLLDGSDNCAPIALAIHNFDNRFSKQLITLLLQAAIVNPRHFLVVIRDLLVSSEFLNSILKSVVLSLGDSPIAEEALQTLWQLSPQEGGIRELMTMYSIRKGEFDKIPAIWNDITPQNGKMCAHFAMQMLRLEKKDIATILFRQVAVVSPHECIRFGYQFFCQPEGRDFVLQCIEPLLPTGSEKNIAQHSIFALRLLHRHGCESRARRIVHELLRNKVIERKEADKILSACMTTRQLIKVDTGDQDDEIEAYLSMHIPTLKRSKFFKAMMSGQANLRGGDRTNSTAVSVVILPHRE